MEMQHSSAKFSHCNAYVSPRRNKDRCEKHEKAIYESFFLNIAMRDSLNFDKMRVVKVIHAMVHKRVFIFYQNTGICDEIS